MEIISNTLHAIFGEHAIDIWVAGFIWALIGIIGVKVWFLIREHHVNIKSFKFKFWINDNAIDVIAGMVFSLIILRLGDYVIHLLQDKWAFTIPETTDFVIYMIVISGAIQWYLHKNRTPVSKDVQAKMHVHNENCKHE